MGACAAVAEDSKVPFFARVILADAGEIILSHPLDAGATSGGDAVDDAGRVAGGAPNELVGAAPSLFVRWPPAHLAIGLADELGC